MFLELLLRVIFFNITECATLPNKDNKMIKLFPQKTSLPPPVNYRGVKARQLKE